MSTPTRIFLPDAWLSELDALVGNAPRVLVLPAGFPTGPALVDAMLGELRAWLDLEDRIAARQLAELDDPPGRTDAGWVDLQRQERGWQDRRRASIRQRFTGDAGRRNAGQLLRRLRILPHDRFAEAVALGGDWMLIELDAEPYALVEDHEERLELRRERLDLPDDRDWPPWPWETE